MKKATWRLGAIVLGALLIASASEAAPITFYSGDGGDLVNGGAAVHIASHAVWGDVSSYAGLDGDEAEWISFANTGVGGIVVPDAVSRTIGNETALYTRQFSLSDDSHLSLWVLADDTATVLLRGPNSFVQTLFTAFDKQFDYCAPGGSGLGLGCMQPDMGHAEVDNLGAGDYTLEVYAFQTHADVFGAQYAGEITSNHDTRSVPEPASLLMLGTGVVGLFAMRSRGRRASR